MKSRALLVRAVVALTISGFLLGGAARVARLIGEQAPVVSSVPVKIAVGIGSWALGCVISYVAIQLVFSPVTRRRESVLTWVRETLEECARASGATLRSKPLTPDMSARSEWRAGSGRRGARSGRAERPSRIEPPHERAHTPKTWRSRTMSESSSKIRQRMEASYVDSHPDAYPSGPWIGDACVEGRVFASGGRRGR
jgi:hypothetical protein